MVEVEVLREAEGAPVWRLQGQRVFSHLAKESLCSRIKNNARTAMPPHHLQRRRVREHRRIVDQLDRLRAVR